MEEKVWFYLDGDKVKGPHSPAEILSQIESKDKTNLSFWIRGETEWSSYEEWQNLLTEKEKSDTVAIELQQRIWKVRIDDVEKSYPHKDLLNTLKDIKDLSTVKIWTDGYSDWKEVYQIHKIMDELGVSRRSHPRVPIMGEMIISMPDNKEYVGKVLTISEGGFGGTGVPEIKMGDKFKVTIKCAQLSTQVYASCEALYISTGSYVGCKFMGLGTESKNAILEYVKKFSDQEDTPPPPKRLFRR